MAHRVLNKLEIHYTQKHGNWLDVAEIEVNVMTRQRLSRSILSIDMLRQELSELESERKNCYAKVNWQIKTVETRIN